MWNFPRVQPEQLQLNSGLPVIAPTFDHICASNPDGVNFDLYDMAGKPLRTIAGEGMKTVGSAFSEDGEFLALFSYTIPAGKGKSQREAVLRIVKVNATVRCGSGFSLSSRVLLPLL